MDIRHQELAAEFCEMIGFDDLLDFFDLDEDVSADAAKAALKKKRTFYQSMQANPKYRDKAKFFIKHFRALNAVLEQPQAHMEHMVRARAAEKLPMLEMAIDSVLADGVLTPQEESFIRESAAAIGIDEGTFEAVLNERLERTGALRAESVLSSHTPLPAPPTFGNRGPGVKTAAPLFHAQSTEEDVSSTKRRRKTSDGWWTKAFTDRLLSQIPKGTQRMVDIACGSAWSALAILPQRDGLEFLGIDREEDRLELARRSIAASPIGHRVALLPGLPHELPVKEESVDCVLSVMALRFFFDTNPIFEEAHRVLMEGGRFLVVEPDGLSQQFYFDGHLNVLNNAYREFMRIADRRLGEKRTGDFTGRPGLAIGPELGARMRAAGFKPHKMVVHPIQGFRQETCMEFAERVSRNIDAVSVRAELSPLDKPVRAVRRALNNIVEMFGPETEGLGGQLQPAFLCVGLKT